VWERSMFNCGRLCPMIKRASTAYASESKSVSHVSSSDSLR
jgi:hypothetical protein